MRKLTVFLIVTLLAALWAGCIAPPPVQEAQQDVEAVESALCASIQAYSASMEALQQVTADTTVEEFNQLKAAADQAHDAMVSAWGELQEAEVQAVESAVAGFQDSLTQVPAEATLGEVATGIQTSAAAVKAAVDQLDQQACAAAE